jgi:hypothetical protein
MLTWFPAAITLWVALDLFLLLLFGGRRRRG